MFSTDDFFAYTGATPAPKKTASKVTPTTRNLTAIRAQVTAQPMSKWSIQASKPVNILSDEFMNGQLKKSARFSNPQPAPAPPQPPIIKNAGELFQRVTQATEARNTAIAAAVIMPKDNQPPRTVLIDSDAMRVQSPLQLVMYSEASFAIFGTTDKTATKKYKDDLQSLGGKFNNWLRLNGNQTPGYIFPMWRIDNVKKYLERF